MNNFEFTGETKVNLLGITLFRIKAIVEIKKHNVKIGDIGGWVSGNAEVYGNAWVSGNAEVSGNALVFDNALVSGDAKVYGDAWVSGDALVSGNAKVYGNAWVSGNAEVSGDALVSGNAWVSGNAKVYGNAWVSGNAEVSGDAEIDNNNRWCSFSCFGSANRTTTIYTTKTGIEIICGCFRGDLKAFIAKVKETHRDSKFGREYMAMVEIIKIKFDIKDR